MKDWESSRFLHVSRRQPARVLRAGRPRGVRAPLPPRAQPPRRLPRAPRAFGTGGLPTPSAPMRVGDGSKCKPNATASRVLTSARPYSGACVGARGPGWMVHRRRRGRVGRSAAGAAVSHAAMRRHSSGRGRVCATSVVGFYFIAVQTHPQSISKGSKQAAPSQCRLVGCRDVFCRLETLHPSPGSNPLGYKRDVCKAGDA
jgi:hypothetical protein